MSRRVDRFKHLPLLTEHTTAPGVRVVWVDPEVPKWIGITGTVTGTRSVLFVDVEVDPEHVHRVTEVRRYATTCVSGYLHHRWAVLPAHLEDSL